MRSGTGCTTRVLAPSCSTSSRPEPSRCGRRPWPRCSEQPHGGRYIPIHGLLPTRDQVRRIRQRSGASVTDSGVAACEGSPFVLGQSAPDSGVLTGLNSPFQAGLNHLHRPQTAFASSVRRRAGPLCPIGKNNSGSTPRQAARSRQVIRIVLLASRSVVSITGVNSGHEPAGVTGSLRPTFQSTSRSPPSQADESDEGPTVTRGPDRVVGCAGTWWRSAIARSPQQLVRDHLVTVRVLAQLWELAAGGLAAKNAACKTNAEWPLAPQGPTVRIWTQATGCSHSPRR
jgi:hypothetical protein